MTNPVLLVGLVAGSVVLSDGDIVPAGLPAFLLQGGAFTLLGFVIYWLLTKHIPNLTSTFETSLNKLTTAFQDEMRRAAEASELELAATRAAFEKRVEASDARAQAKDELVLRILEDRKP